MKLGLCFIVNNSCTNRCKYCYEKFNNEYFLTKESFKRTIAFFENSVVWNKEIEFFGGEPMLNNNQLRDIINTYYEFNYSLITNGFFFNEDDYWKYLKGFEKVHISVSLEANKETHNYFRNPNDNYEKMLNRILDNKENDLSINMSINKKMFENLDDTINNINKIINSNKEIHFYLIKGNDEFKTLDDFNNCLNLLKEKSVKIYTYLLKNLIKGIESDFEFLCSFDKKITVLPNGDLISCMWDKTFYGNIETNILDDILKNYIERISYNHKTVWQKCNECEVPVGICNVSCTPYIMNQLEKGEEDKLNLKCEIQKELFRRRRELECQI